MSSSRQLSATFDENLHFDEDVTTSNSFRNQSLIAVEQNLNELPVCNDSRESSEERQLIEDTSAFGHRVERLSIKRLTASVIVLTFFLILFIFAFVGSLFILSNMHYQVEEFKKHCTCTLPIDD